MGNATWAGRSRAGVAVAVARIRRAAMAGAVVSGVTAAMIAAGTARADIIQTTLPQISAPYVPAAVSNTGDLAQSLTAPNVQGLSIQSFQVVLGSGGLEQVMFRGALYQFDPFKPAVVGLPLYASEIRIAEPISISGYQVFSFDTGGIPVTLLGSYALVLQQDHLGNTTNYQVPLTPPVLGDVYPEGKLFVIDANQSPFPNLSGDSTYVFRASNPTWDLGFSVTYDVPEPASAIAPLLALLVRRRGRRNA